MGQTRKVLLIGANGFGKQHLNELIRQQDEGVLELAAVSDLRLSEEAAAVVGERGIRFYTDYREMLAKEKDASFVVISTPIQLHARMGIEAMEAGYHVLLEKPPAAVIQDAQRIADMAKKCGKLCAVNFFTPSRRALSMLTGIASSGEIGEVKAIKGISLLHRSASYFTRTPWAGKLSVQGVTVLDGTFHNPAAHLFYSMINISERLSEQAGRSGNLTSVTAELYRANPIESDDTSCVRLVTEGGLSLHLYITVCARQGQTQPQRIRLEGSEGAVEWSYDNKVTLWKGADSVVYDCHDENFMAMRYRNLIDVMGGREQKLDVSIESAIRFTVAANGAFESSGVVHSIPQMHTRSDMNQGKSALYVEGIEQTLLAAFREGKLLSELGDVPWAKRTESFGLSGYSSFPQRFNLGQKASTQ
ncbi:Gfo/Idh/MocA family oxidoreductase [Paenibacillus sp. GYB004]|uniref:Gfo/Idh/MocA family protein n=1 Tax=Paenibacillus sp. GYB004 TaxID=2994393 RepID=UPI002F967415